MQVFLFLTGSKIVERWDC